MRSQEKLWLAFVVLMPGGFVIAPLLLLLRRHRVLSRLKALARGRHALTAAPTRTSIAPVPALGRSSVF